MSPALSALVIVANGRTSFRDRYWCAARTLPAESLTIQVPGAQPEDQTMSKAQLERFIGTLSNPASVNEATKGARQPEQILVNVMSYAKTNGYDFTEAEVKAWVTEQSAVRPGGELSDSQLEEVAGGENALRVAARKIFGGPTA